MSYIEREAAVKRFTFATLDCLGMEPQIRASDAVKAIETIPVADVVEVVRCKDCRCSYDDMGGLCCSHGVCVDCVVPEDFFCRYGKRKGWDE